MAAQLEKYESRIRLELIKLLFLFCEHHNDPLALTPYHDTQTPAVQRERT